MSINVSSVFCVALSLLVLFCCQGFCRRPPRPTEAPHYYTTYPLQRSSIQQLVDGSKAALYYLGQISSTQGYVLPRYAPDASADITFRDAVSSALKVYEINSHISLPADVIRGVENSICDWITNAMQSGITFTCSESNIQQLSQILDLYNALQDTLTQVKEINPDTATSSDFHLTNCAWVNSRVLGGCTDIPAPQSIDPIVGGLEDVFSCSTLRGDYDLCANL